MTVSTRARATERVVILLRPSEKQKLVRMARRDNVSAAEILRRSLEAYVSAEAPAEGKLLAQMEKALDQIHVTLQRTHERIDASLRESERLREDPAHHRRIAQLDRFIAKNSTASSSRKNRTKAA